MNVPKELPKPTHRQVPEPKVIRRQIDVLPAQPGFNFITPISDGIHREVIDVARDPIIGWRIETETYEHHDGDVRVASTAMPITTGHTCASGAVAHWAVEYPDGRCNLPFDSTFDSAAGLLKWWQELQAR